jgi:CheY-like chemotaxis protein
MKSCQCAQCNVSSARFAWGFALLARDGWGVAPASDLLSTADGAWLCATCRWRSEVASPDPARRQPAKLASNTRSRPSGKLRVLLVDDEEIVRRCTARMLGDFEVVSAASALEALRILRNDNDFDAVLSDVMMPGMSGPELYAVCYRNFPTVAQRFVFASGNAEAARTLVKRAVDSVEAEQAPILLAKPSSREALVLALYAAAAHGQPHSGTYSAIGSIEAEVTKYRG